VPGELYEVPDGAAVDSEHYVPVADSPPEVAAPAGLAALINPKEM